MRRYNLSNLEKIAERYAEAKRDVSYFTRYMAGDHEVVWAELSALGENVRSRNALEDARAVAAETMRRVEHNLLILKERLPACGYRFNAPTTDPPKPVYRTADREDFDLLHILETESGPLPISLHAFYSIVGEVDFSQDYEQLIQWPAREDGAPYTELQMLAEFNPLSVSTLAVLMAHRLQGVKSVEAPLVPDEAGNAFYSGDYYYTELPNSNVDASIGTYFGGSEDFVGYLRQAFRHSGFHGMPNAGAGTVSARWNFPSLPCLLVIVRDLLPI